jgi:hypothetical protein
MPSLIRPCVLAAALCITVAGAQAQDQAKYPDWKGRWLRVEPGNPVKYDPSKPPGLAQQAPLTPEYQAILEASIADQAAGGQGGDPTYTCLSPGMPRVMSAYSPMEIVVTPETTHILIEHIWDNRRIYTDGRDWPADPEPSFLGYSIGKWIDTERDGTYDTLEVETRHFKGPRVFEASGIPLHKDNQSVIRERIYLNKSNPNLMHNELTTIDHALTRPWTVIKNYRRAPNPRPVWRENMCTENNQHVRIGRENYMLSADGYLMPSKKDQAPPDLKYFGQARK